MSRMNKKPNDKLNWGGIEGEFLGRITDYSDLFLKASAKSDYQIALEKVSKSMIRFKKPEYLIKMIIRILDKQVATTQTAVLLYNEKRHAFVLFDSKGTEGRRAFVGKGILSINRPLVTVFTREDLAPLLDENGVLIYERINKLLNDKKILNENPHLAAKLKDIKQEMEVMRASICIPSYFKKKLLGILILGDKLSSEKFKQEEIEFFLMLANHAAMAISNAKLIDNLQDKVKEVESLYEKTNSLFVRISIAFATAIDARDPYTHGHTVRVTGYSLAIAEELHISKEMWVSVNFRENLHIAALLHDIGKIGIPDNILHKREKLTTEEVDKIRRHPEIGATILYPIKELNDILGGVRSHQEKFDGTGYPDGLKGPQIPLLARIIAVADAFDAITSSRPYRNKKTQQEAISEIQQCTGTQFDPKITDLFLKAYEKKRF